MQKFFITILACLLANSVFAISNINASDYEDFNNTLAGQKSITNKEFDEVVNALEKKKKDKEEKAQKKKLKKFKGESLHQNLDATIEDLPDQTIEAPEMEEQVVLFHVDVIVGDNLIEKGYYRVFAEKENGVLYLKFFQAHKLVGKLKARETDDDFGEQDIMFVKVLPHKEGVLKIIYGAIDYNAYAFIRYVEPTTDFRPQ